LIGLYLDFASEGLPSGFSDLVLHSVPMTILL